MNKLILAIIALTFFSNQLYSQNTIKGKVCNTKDGKPLAWVNIGISGKDIGTVSDEDGCFTLDIEDLSDTLQLSMIGYEHMSFLLNKYKTDKALLIQMNEKSYKIAEVGITKRKIKTKRFGRRAHTNQNTTGYPSGGLGAQLATLIKNKKGRVHFTDFSFYIAESSFETLTFRLNFYAATNDGPGEQLLKENIIYTCTQTKGKVTIPLDEYHVFIDQDVYASLEIIKIGKKLNSKHKGLMFRAVFGGKAFDSGTSFSEWERLEMVSAAFNLIGKY